MAHDLESQIRKLKAKVEEQARTIEELRVENMGLRIAATHKVEGQLMGGRARFINWLSSAFPEHFARIEKEWTARLAKGDVANFREMIDNDPELSAAREARRKEMRRLAQKERRAAKRHRVQGGDG